LVKTSLDEQRAHRVFVEDAQDGFRQQRRDRQLPDLGARLRVLAQRDGIGDRQLVQVGTVDALDLRHIKRVVALIPASPAQRVLWVAVDNHTFDLSCLLVVILAI
jgi:hypothetical protein